MAKNTSQSDEKGKIAWPAANTTDWNGSSKFRIVNTAGIPPEAQVLTKVGRTTGNTSGNVDVNQICVTRNQNNADGTPTDRTLLCQYRATYANAGGDSGSPVFAVAPTGDVTLKGIHWGSAGWFTAIGNVTIELGVTSVCWTSVC